MGTAGILFEKEKLSYATLRCLINQRLIRRFLRCSHAVFVFANFLIVLAVELFFRQFCAFFSVNSFA